MYLSVFFGIILPLIGTTLGAAAVFFAHKKSKNDGCLSGFSAGVMMAASVWSLIIPAVEMSQNLGRFAFSPMLCGLWAGVIFLISGELFSSSEIGKDSLFFFAVILHNIPEGMAVGVAFATAISQNSSALLLSAMMLSVGVTIQNIPEGAIISMPLHEKGSPRIKAFANGALSGLPEPVFAFLTLIFSSVSAAVLPYLLGFAAGAMIYVSVKDLIPMAKGKKGCLAFLSGFSVMMVLDVALG